ncbi:hypothetical protein M408DRAFT_110952 [Serendipita vermifera MAFF 305830]|uniref:Uncharacterized protein n=1 Tax=Serendipita vermifera MAFF 305830 TaxID=933852 RepID=A0A0C3A942_SERVB|nr:hypothetical protein M408DRAFT_110952 [Serendipita vermifera MAFF 305830]
MSTSLFLFGLLHVLANTSLFTKCLATPLPNFPQNYTIDDHNFDRIFYVNADEWKHSLMTSGSFHGDSLSSTQNLGSSASFIFYGTGIWISGPFSPEQARRRIYLDGMDMGLFHANSIFPEPPRPFWGMSGLDDSMHTVVVVHNDSTQMILSIDSWTFQTHSSHHPSRLVNRSSIPTTILSEMGTNVSGVDFSVVGGSTKTPDTVTILLSCIIPTVFLLLCLISYMIHRRVVDTPPGVKANPDSTRPLTHHEPASIPPTSAKVSDPQNSVSALDDYLPSKVIDSGSSTSTGNIVGKQVDSSRHLSTYGTPRNMWAEPSSTSEAGTSPLNLVRPQEPQVVLGTTRGQPSGYYSPRNVTYMISKGSSSAIPGSSLRSTGVTRARSRRENEDNSSSGSEFLFPSAIPSKVVHARGVQLHDEIVGPPLNSPPREIRASHSPTILSNISSLAENEDKVLGLRAHSSRPSAHQEPTDIPPTSREVLNRRKTVTPLDDFVGSWTAGGGPGASTKNIARKQTVSTHPNTYVTTRLKSRRETVTVKGSSKPLRSGPQKGPNVTSRYHQHPPYPSKAPLPRSLGAPAAPIVSSPSVAGSSSRLSYSLSAHRGEDHPPGSGQSTITTTIRLVQGMRAAELTRPGDPTNQRNTRPPF